MKATVSNPVAKMAVVQAEEATLSNNFLCCNLKRLDAVSMHTENMMDNLLAIKLKPTATHGLRKKGA